MYNLILVRNIKISYQNNCCLLFYFVFIFMLLIFLFFFFFSSRRRHTRYIGDWSSDVCSSDLLLGVRNPGRRREARARASRRKRDLYRTRRVVGFEGRIQGGLQGIHALLDGRSEERRVGKECRSGWWPEH